MMSSTKYDRLYEIAEGQAGYFTSRQAGEAGVDRSVLSRQVQAGRLRRVRHGIYRLVHFPAAPDEDLVVAWLETGPASVISYDSALALHHLSDALPAEIHVTVPRTASHRRPGIRLHTNRLAPQEITRRNGVAVTTVPRTIADVAASGLSEEFVIQAVREALINGLSTPEDLLSAARSERVRDLIGRSLEEAVTQ
jgi:predicted transcriptional regulator of viral defense system